MARSRKSSAEEERGRIDAERSRLTPCVAHAFDGHDDPRSRGVELDLLSKVGDGHVDGAGLDVVARAPHMDQQLVSRNGAAAMPIEPAQDPRFAGGQRNDMIVAPGLAAAEVEA